MLQFWTIPDPPPNVSVRLERTDDSVEFSGTPTTSKSLPAEKPELGGSSPVFLFARVFSRFWTCGVMVIFGFGIIFLLFVLGLVLFGDVPFEMNGKPLGTGVAVAFVVAFLTAWVVGGVVMLRGGRHIRSVLAVVSGEAPARQWRLRIDRNRIDAIQEEMGRATGACQCSPEDVRRIFVKPDGVLVAESADRSSATVSDLVLAGPLDQQDADWLEDTLRHLLDLRG
jgi:hypothetical protein